MMTRTMIRATLVGALALAVALPAQAETVRTEVAEYVGSGAFTAPTGCFYGLGDDPNIGGACFWIDESEETVSITVDDVSPLPAGADLTFMAGSEVAQSVLICESVENHPIPEGATTLIVSTDSVTGSVSCLGRGGAAIAGTITAEFVTP